VSALLPPERDRGGLRWVGGGAVAAAVAYVLTAACCLPLVLGVAAGATVAARFGFLARYQPYLGGIALLLVAVAFYRAYRRPGRSAGECAPARPGIALWLLAVAVLVLLTAPFWMPGPG
jgi:hypothetical protein